MHPKQLTHACQTPHKVVAMLGFVGQEMKFIYIEEKKGSTKEGEGGGDCKRVFRGARGHIYSGRSS